MKRLTTILFSVFVACLAVGLSAGEAEAKRLGGGGSFGMQRQSVAPRPAPVPYRQAAPASPAPATPAPAPATPKRSWLGPLAGLAAGLGLGALFSHFGLGEGFGNLLMFAALAMAAVFVLKLLTRRGPPAEAPPMRYAGAEGAVRPPPVALPDVSPAPPTGGGGATAWPHAASPALPAGFDADAFLRVAKLNFVRLQAANDAGNLDDIREFVTPEVFAEIKLQLDERGNARQRTDVVTLNAELLEVATEGGRHIASVRFNGLIRETADGPAQAFDEIWNLSKPVDDSRGWAVAGIQQA